MLGILNEDFVSKLVISAKVNKEAHKTATALNMEIDQILTDSKISEIYNWLRVSTNPKFIEWNAVNKFTTKVVSIKYLLEKSNQKLNKLDSIKLDDLTRLSTYYCIIGLAEANKQEEEYAILSGDVNMKEDSPNEVELTEINKSNITSSFKKLIEHARNLDINYKKCVVDPDSGKQKIAKLIFDTMMILKIVDIVDSI